MRGAGVDEAAFRVVPPYLQPPGGSVCPSSHPHGTTLTEIELAQRLALAALIGLAVGTEREWSGPPDGPNRRFAGLRTFLMFGLLGGIGGALIEAGALLAAGAVLAAGSAFNLAAYVMTTRRPGASLDGTTEAAGLVVIALGALAAMGHYAVAAGGGAVVVFALGEKQRLHWLVSRIGEREMHAALQFLVLALVILPVLPSGPYPQFFDARPRALWAIVLVLSGINFASYIARRAVGPGRGYGVTGALAGLISSTALTVQFSRLSRLEPQHARGLGLGVMAASMVVPVRVMLVSVALNPAVARELAGYMVPPLLIAGLHCALLLRNSSSVEAPAADPRNPLRLRSALEMTALLTVAFVAIAYAAARWGASGLAASSVLFGLVDVDALTVSMSRLPDAAASPDVAARAIAIGMLSNTTVKLAVTQLVGTSAYRRITFSGLSLSALVLGAVLWWRWG